MKIGIFDDHTLISLGLSGLIKKFFPEMKLFTCSSRSELFVKIVEEQPDILILDIISPEVTGLELFEKIAKDFTSIKTIAYTALTSPVLVENLLAMNVRAYLHKRQPEEEIVSAISLVIRGEIYVPEEYKYLFKKLQSVKENTMLSEREREIIRLIAHEFTSSAIAEKLNIAENTVENHRKNIFQKLKVKNSAGLVTEATRLGYLS